MNLRGPCGVHGRQAPLAQLPPYSLRAPAPGSDAARPYKGKHRARGSRHARLQHNAVAQAVQAEAEVAARPQPAIQVDIAVPGSLVPLHLQQGTVIADGSRPVLQGLTEHAQVTASSRGQLVLGLTSPGHTAMFDVALGQLKCRRFLACARCKLWWMTPEWGSTAGQIPPETQFVLLELEESRLYAVLLPLIDSGTWRGTLRPPPRQWQDLAVAANE